jgi:hypothetical protein
MNQVRHGAVEILARVASVNPAAFRALFGVGSCSNPVALAEAAAASVSHDLSTSPEGAIVERFGEYMRFLGRIERTVRRRCDYLLESLLALGIETLDAASEGDRESVDRWNDWVASRTDQFVSEASALLSSWRQFRRDTAAAESSWDFRFLDIARGRPDLGSAAVAAGGRPLCPGPDKWPDIVLVELPFSVFVGVSENDDPAVTDVVGGVSRIIRKARGALFRVDWTVGTRLSLPTDGYQRAVSRASPQFETRIILLDETLYVGVARSWHDEFSAVTVPLGVGPDRPVERAVRGFLRAVELG